MCERIFNVYSHPLMTSIFQLTVPSPQQLITNKNGRQHLELGTAPEEIQEREHKSTFNGAFRDGTLLHNTIDRTVEPCRNGEKTYTEFLVHKVHIKTGPNTWSFVFHQPHPPYYKPRNRLCWSNQVPRRRNLLPKTNHYHFLRSSIHQYVPSWNVV